MAYLTIALLHLRPTPLHLELQLLQSLHLIVLRVQRLSLLGRLGGHLMRQPRHLRLQRQILRRPRALDVGEMEVRLLQPLLEHAALGEQPLHLLVVAVQRAGELGVRVLEDVHFVGEMAVVLLQQRHRGAEVVALQLGAVLQFLVLVLEWLELSGCLSFGSDRSDRNAQRVFTHNLHTQRIDAHLYVYTIKPKT